MVLIFTVLLVVLASQGFSDASLTLAQWLDKGYVSNRNSNRFYTMLHSVNSSVRRLLGQCYVIIVCSSFT